MVKRIKKRVPKKTEEVVEEGTEVEVEGSAVGETAATNEADPVEQGDALRLEIAENAKGPAADGFSELMEGFLLSLADNWVSVLLIISVGLGVYGFKQFSDQSAKVQLAEDRQAIEKLFTEYEALNHQALRALKAKTSKSDANVLGISVDPASEVEAPQADSYKQVAAKFAKLKVSSKLAPLAKLAEASTTFDSASSSADYEKAAELFLNVAKNGDVEPIAQSLAFRNAAVALEEAAFSAEAKAQKALWTKAADAWQAFGEADRAIFGLNAQVNRARVLRVSGDQAAAHKAYEEIKRAYEAALKDPKNNALNAQVKLGLALTATTKATKDK